jgi:prevent-host-death family protein
MARHVASEKARANWREILDAVDSGEEIVIERYGRPVAVLAPYHERISAPLGQAREPAPVYDTATLERLKSEVVAEVIAELNAKTVEPISWAEGWAELQRLMKESGSPFANMTTDEIVEKMRETRREIFEAEYAHLYR